MYTFAFIVPKRYLKYWWFCEIRKKNRNVNPEPDIDKVHVCCYNFINSSCDMFVGVFCYILFTKYPISISYLLTRLYVYNVYIIITNNSNL